MNLYHNKSRKLKILLFKLRSLLEGREFDLNDDNDNNLKYELIDKLNEMSFFNKLQYTINNFINKNVSFIKY